MKTRGEPAGYFMIVEIIMGMQLDCSQTGIIPGIEKVGKVYTLN